MSKMISDMSKALTMTRIAVVLFAIILFLIALQIYSIKSSQVSSYYEKRENSNSRASDEEQIIDTQLEDDSEDEEKPNKALNGTVKTEEKANVESNEAKKTPPKEVAKKSDKSRNCDRWIVITSISEPTDHVKYIQDALIDWCLVVVGDSKSPSNWAYKDAVFLSLKDQNELLAKRYKLVAQIPVKSYLRKVIGYLYAIDHGAKFIYETDDDNSALDGLLGFKYREMRGVEMACEPITTFINPYAYFGQPSMWPRGYPLEMISENALDFNCSKFRISSDVPLIQQGLVNGDPDVDAIYRLTRKQSTKLLYVKFDSKAPSLVLNKRQYAPINSQNTFFHYASFWSLVFPRNVTFREVDILRGYIAIRLFQEIDGRVGFFAPNAVQIRNAHSYHKDYLEEKRLYESILRFVQDLEQWVCDKKRKENQTSIKDCFIQCIEMLIKKKHLSESELEFYQIWINDLDNLGYRWPEMRTWTPLRDAKLSQTVHLKAVEQEHSSNSNNNEKSIVQTGNEEAKMSKVLSMCKLAKDKLIDIESIDRMDDAILVTWVKSREQVEFISNVVNIHFKFIFACYASKIDGLAINEFIVRNTSGGIALLDAANFRQCVYTATNMGYKLNSFVFAQDLALFEYWRDGIKLVLPEDKQMLNYNDYDTNNKDEELLAKNVYFVRKTVANGQRIIKSSSSPNANNFNTTSYCLIYSANNNDYRTISKKFERSLNSLKWHSNDLVTESCAHLTPRTIWIADVNGPSRLDIFSTLLNLGQNPRLVGAKTLTNWPKSLSSYVSLQMSEFAKNFTSMSKLTDASMKEHFQFYKDNADFKNVDAVICSFSSSMCEAFIPLNKTIIFNPANRYNLGRCNKESWSNLNANYQKLKSKSKLVVAAMSRYDEEYQAHFTGLRGYKLYSHNTLYPSSSISIYNPPNKNEILVDAPKDATSEQWLNEIKQLEKSKSLVFKRTSEAVNNSDGQITAAAVVVFPHQITAYSPFIDYYRFNLPIFVPSLDLILKYKSAVSTRTIFPQCGGQFDPIKPYPKSRHLEFDPNSDKDEDFKYWMKYTNYYRLPFVTIFTSWSDLVDKLQSVDLSQISNSMYEFNKIRQAYVLDNWCRLIKTRLSRRKQQSMPESFEQAVSYFNITNV